MDKKKILCNWLLTIIFSNLIIFIIQIFVRQLNILFAIVWTISYTLFYFIRNRKVLFKRFK